MSNETSNRPVYYAHVVRERDKGRKPVWTRIGAVWAHRDGEGFSLELEAIPVNFDGRLVLLPPRLEEADSAKAGS